MNFLRLSRYFYSRRPLQEAVVLVQLVLMFLYAIAVFSPIDQFAQFSGELRSVYAPLDYSRTVFFNPNFAVYDNMGYLDTETKNVVIDVAEEALASVGAEEPLRAAAYTARVGTDDNTNLANLIVLSDEALAATDSALADMLPAASGSAAFVLVSRSLASLLPVGTKFILPAAVSELALVDEDGVLSIPCEVVGVLPDDTILPITSRHASGAYLSCFGLKLSNYSGSHFLVMRYSETVMPDISWDASFLARLPDGADVSATVDALNDAVGAAFGEFTTMQELERDAFQTVITNNSSDVFEFVLLSLLALFGYGGYLFLMTYQRQKEFSVFYILGMTRRKMLAMNCLFACLNLLLALGIACACFPAFRSAYGYEDTATFGVVSISYCGVLLLAVLLLSFLSAFRRFRNASTISLLQGGD